MKLIELQKAFSLKVAQLIGHAYSEGYSITFGEAYRPPETAELYAKQGRGSKTSLHCDRLAIDLNVFKDGKYLTDAESYRDLGEYWESLGTSEIPTRWGGYFSSGDANHFSVEYNGRK